MGPVTGSGDTHGRAAGAARLAKKALTLRSRAAAAKRNRGPARATGAGRATFEGSVAWAQTFQHGRPRQLADLRWQHGRGQQAELWLVIVDASGSTRRHGALSDGKGLLATFFDRAYRERARLALLTASGQSPQWQRHGLKASRALLPWLRELGAGGGTPLGDALRQARTWLARRQRQYPQERQRCLILTDGRLKDWENLPELGCESLLVDLEKGPIRLGRARLIAKRIGATYWPVHRGSIQSHSSLQ